MRPSFIPIFALVLAAVAAGGCASNRYADAFAGATEEDKASGKVPLEAPAPEYPRLARQGGVEGCVTVAFDVLPSGRTDNFQVLDSKPKGNFDHAMLLALKDWRYPPRKEPIRLVNRTNFSLGDEYGGPDCLDESEIPEAMLHPGESPPESGRPTVVKKAFPDFPGQALKRGIEQGCVTVTLDVLQDGTTANILVLDSEPAGIFDREAIEAAEKLKFARRKEVTRIAYDWTFGTARAGERPKPLEVSCLETDAVPERFLIPGPEQPEPPNEW